MVLRFGCLLLVLAVSACEGGNGRDPDLNAGTHAATAGPMTGDDGVVRWLATVNGVPVRIRVARTRTQHFKGLAGVKLAADEGMFFMYGPKEARGFWMKGCVIGLDIAWLSDDLTVLKIDTLPAPGPKTTDETMPRASAPEPIKFILEMPAGWFARQSLAAGARITVPAALLRKKVE